SGRGLFLVDALSDRWGVEADPAGSGKTVWTELDRTRRRAS
ncbi:ATP-binding protein, partial [Streptomyces sp. K1PA1]